ncbi:nucleotidyltransferase domain-containing protein [Candidatus Woesearchaeota archaeon]|nr:nucleotidyltransferase domain-containing protein [Candidatus Woesearchaeota archaeon]
MELFFNEPSKHWHFSSIVSTAKISEPSANKWLQKMLKEKIALKIKPKGKMPFFIANFRHDNYRNKKKIYAIEKMYQTGLLSKLQGLKARTVIVFGSFARSDWNTQSDIDVFVLGDPEDLKYGIAWSGLGMDGKAREVEVHCFSSEEDMRSIQTGLMNNVVKGYFVKGNIHDVAKVLI